MRRIGARHAFARNTLNRSSGALAIDQYEIATQNGNYAQHMLKPNCGLAGLNIYNKPRANSRNKRKLRLRKAHPFACDAHRST